MKKRIFLSIFALCLLTGCGRTAEEASSNITNESSYEVICEDIDYSLQFTTEEDFLKSERCQDIRTLGAVIYTPRCDNERYEFKEIISNLSSYVYYFYDNQAETIISYTISYHDSYTDFNELMTLSNNSDDIVTTAQNNGIDYEVYLSATPYVDYVNYGLVYIPIEKYRVSIYSSKHATAEEILEYFDDFELVPLPTE